MMIVRTQVELDENKPASIRHLPNREKQITSAIVKEQAPKLCGAEDGLSLNCAQNLSRSQRNQLDGELGRAPSQF